MLLKLLKTIIVTIVTMIFFAPALDAQTVKVQTGANDLTLVERESKMWLGEEIRRRLVTQNFYDVFDWLAGELREDGTLILRGSVTRPSLKSNAERSVAGLVGVKNIVNEIEVLPPSPDDENLRRRIYKSVYSFNSPLFRYAVRAVPPIHIIVNGGRAMLKGAVATETESRLAENYVRQVPGVFEVKNGLHIESDDSKS